MGGVHDIYVSGELFATVPSDVGELLMTEIDTAVNESRKGWWLRFRNDRGVMVQVLWTPGVPLVFVGPRPR